MAKIYLYLLIHLIIKNVTEGATKISRRAIIDSEATSTDGHDHREYKDGVRKDAHEMLEAEKFHKHEEGKGHDHLSVFDKDKKGHHDKEDNDKNYEESSGEEKKVYDETGHYIEHHEGEKGDKVAEFEEDAKYQKGHSTKGEHNIYRNDEYEKKHNFHDEYYDEDGHGEIGDFYYDHEEKKGGHNSKGHHDLAHHQDEYDENGKHVRGHHHHDDKDHKFERGHDHDHKNSHRHKTDKDEKHGKKWAHHHQNSKH